MESSLALPTQRVLLPLSPVLGILSVVGARAQTQAPLPGIWKPLQRVFAFRLHRLPTANLLERYLKGEI